MTLPRLSPEELVEELSELARASFVDTFPHVEQDQTLEADAAAFIQSASALLTDLAAEGGQVAERAQRILDRLE
ncbi:hypothetical protein G6L15_08555 [Agrobacterium rhizogenes]|uniref:hypothetical protein n=1 Tax=Rhizobium rhizogenes TaxID=359 RepID=UPI0015724357|nr:hypothetical protein [Rhizobium rhizogenes]NTG86195.1 hypothetical protein [Rhizobium rhizogenes]